MNVGKQMYFFFILRHDSEFKSYHVSCFSTWESNLVRKKKHESILASRVLTRLRACRNGHVTVS